jgi:hypothetical protein
MYVCTLGVLLVELAARVQSGRLALHAWASQHTPSRMDVHDPGSRLLASRIITIVRLASEEGCVGAAAVPLP